MATTDLDTNAGKSRTSRSDEALIAWLADRLGPPLGGDDVEFSAEDARDAAAFLYTVAASRAEGEPALAIESVGGPVGARKTRIAVVNDDMPFLVDSMATTIAGFGLAIDRLVHPILPVERDEDGRLVGWPEDDAGFPRESMVYVETERADARTRVALGQALRDTLAEVRAAVRDWPKLQAAMVADAGELARRGREHAEEAALLRWLSDDKLTQLGHVSRSRDGGESERLGICALGDAQFLLEGAYERAFAWFDAQPSAPLLIVKANRISRVHRRVPLDLFLVPVLEKGRVTALSLHVGIWTSAALAAPPSQVPILRRQLEAMMDGLQFDPHSHAGKALVHALTRLPHDVLIGFAPSEVERIATTMMSLIDRPRSHLVLVRSPLGRHLFTFVWLPRDALSTDVREQALAMIVDAAQAKLLDWTLEVDGALVTIRAVLDIREDAPHVDEAPIAARLRAMVRGWPEELEAALAASEAPGRAAALAARYADAFPLGYRGAYGAVEAAADVIRLMALGDGPDQRTRDARLHCFAGCPEDGVRLKLYQRHGALPLSDAVPMLENFGFRVIGEMGTPLGEDLGAIHDFELQLPLGSNLRDILAHGDEIERAIAAVLVGEAEDDAFNRLIAAVGHERAAGELAARVLSLHAPERAEFRDRHGGRRAGRCARGRARPGRTVRRAPRSRAQVRPRGGGGRGRRGDPAGPRGGHRDQRRPPAAPLPGRGRGDPAHQRLRAGAQGRSRDRAGVQARFRARARPAARRCRGARSGSIRRGSRASTCAPARSRAAACAGPTGATTSAPRCSG